MKLTRIDLSSDNGNTFTFRTADIASNDRYLLKASVGLDADELIHKYYGKGQSSSTKFHNVTLGKREVVLRIGLNPNYSVNEKISSLRDAMYRAIASSRSGLVNLLLYSGGGVVGTLSGFINKFEVPHYSKDAELQITIKCDDPVIRGYSPSIYGSADITWANPVIFSDSVSTAPHGFSIKLSVDSAISAITIKDDAVSPDWEFTVTPSGGFAIGDTLYLSSEYGNKYLYKVNLAETVTTHLMDRISPGSIWPIMFPGMNEFVFDEIADITLEELSFYPAHWGV